MTMDTLIIVTLAAAYMWFAGIASRLIINDLKTILHNESK